MPASTRARPEDLQTIASTDFRGLIFLDLDGTLEDSRQDMAACVNRLRKNLGLGQKAEQDLYPLVIKGMEFLYRSCFPEVIEDPSLLRRATELPESLSEQAAISELATLYESYYSEHIVDSTNCYAGMEAALIEMDADYSLGLYTNKPEGLSRLLLSRLNILDRFVLLYGGDTLVESKPSPLPLRTGIQTIATSLDTDFESIQKRTIMIGDSAGDVKAGREAGVSTIWAAYGYYDSIDETPDHTAHNPQELPELVASILD